MLKKSGQPRKALPSSGLRAWACSPRGRLARLWRPSPSGKGVGSFDRRRMRTALKPDCRFPFIHTNQLILSKRERYVGNDHKPRKRLQDQIRLRGARLRKAARRRRAFSLPRAEALELAKSCTPRAMYATAAALAKAAELAQFGRRDRAPCGRKIKRHRQSGRVCLFETPVPPADTLDTARRILMLEACRTGNVGTLLRRKRCRVRL